jgi:hypothetical protein
MGKLHRDDEPEESTDVEQTEDDSEGHFAKGKFREDEDEESDSDDSEPDSDGENGGNDTEGHKWTR